MPVVNVHRYSGTVVVNDTHEQTVGTLVFGGLTNVVLDATTFPTAGTYSIFKYTPTTGFPGGQTDLNTYVTFSMSGPGRTVVDTHGTNDTTNSRVTVTLT
jgi:hypothetical protein